MKKMILSLAFAGSLIIMAASACNSTKNVSGTTDSTTVDTAMTPVTPPVDTGVVDTTRTTPPDTTGKM